MERERRERLRSLELAYLASEDPIRQSGFGGGARRWRAEREPILAAVERSGSLIDVCCANGFLLECLVEWGAERGLELDAWGLDIGAELIALARERSPRRAHQLFQGDAVSWEPPRRFDYVYTLADVVPRSELAGYLSRLLGRLVGEGGRLIVGAYGSRSRALEPLDVAGLMAAAGHRVVGSAAAGDPPVVRFAWAEV